MRRLNPTRLLHQISFGGCIFPAALLLMLWSLLLLGGCATPKKTTAMPEINLNTHELALEYYVLGNNYYYKGLLEPAFRAYEQALLFEPDKAALRDLIVARALESGRSDLAARVAERVPAQERSAKEWKLLGEAYLRSGRLDDAEAALAKALPLLPEDPAVHYTMGIIYEARKKLPKAIESFRLAGRLSGGSSESEEKSALRYLQIGNADSARTILGRLAGQYPGEPRFLRSLAAVEEAKGNDSGALAAYNRILEKDSTDAAAWSSLGNLHFRLDQWANAQRCYRMIYKGDSADWPIGRALAYTCIQLHQLDSAEQLLKRMLSFRGEEADLHYYLGLVYSDRASSALEKTPADTALADEQYESALIELNKAVALAKDFQEAEVQLGFVNLHKKLPAEAERVFLGVVEKWPKGGRFHLYLALAQRALGRKDKAISSLNQAVKLDPKNSGALFELGSLYEQTGEFEKSEKALEQLLTLEPKHALALNYLGYMRAEKGIKLEESRNMIERALAIEPDNSAFLDSYGWVLFKLGKVQKAEEYLLKALAKLKTPDPVILDHLGDVYRALKEDKKAGTYYEKALALDPKNEAIRKKLGL